MPNHPPPSAKNETGEFAQFTHFMKQLVSVPHSEIQKRLKAEKLCKASASPGPASGKTTR